MFTLDAIIGILFNGIFYGSILFLIAAGLQLIFGVQRILNLACGSFYALGVYTGVTFIEFFMGIGLPHIYFIIALIIAGLILGFIGPIIERGILKPIYAREMEFQLLATFALVLIFEDVIRFVWGIYPKISKVSPVIYGELRIGATILPIYYIFVIVISLTIALFMGFMIKKTKLGKTLRAISDNREMSAALGVNVNKFYLLSFTIGTIMGTIGGSLMAPVTAAWLGLGVEIIVYAFAVVVIGGLGSMIGAFIGAMIVGVFKGLAIAIYPELEVLIIYAVVIAILIMKPSGLFGRIEE
ncbi:MAG: branched-chain amino acid ABC transporter permease [Nitrososphaerales archaeon]